MQSLITDFFPISTPRDDLGIGLDALPDIALNRVASFLDERAVNDVILAANFNIQIRRTFQESKMRLTMYCNADGVFEKRIRYSMEPDVWFSTCSSFHNIKATIDEQFAYAARYSAEIYKMIGGVRTVVFKVDNPLAEEEREFQTWY
jgi:hypothetical protein